MTTTEDTLVWVDKYMAARSLIVNFASEVSRAEEDADEELRVMLAHHRMSVLNQLALIEGRSRFVVLAGSAPSEAT